jgi:hypothetical protein
MNYKNIIIASLFLISLNSCAQQKYGIRKADAFFSEHLPGNIRVDREGNSLYHGPAIVNTIYIETKGSPVKWIVAWKGGQSFSVVTTEIKERPFEAGTEKETNEKILLKPAPGNKLWQLVLVKDETSSKVPSKIKSARIILQGKWGGKKIYQKIDRQVELAAVPSV